MAGIKKVQSIHDQLVKLEESEMEDFRKAISPLSISEFFRQQQHDIVEEYRKKKERPEGEGLVFFSGADQKQATLDLFAKEQDVINYMKELKANHKDAEIRKLGRNGQLLNDMCKTYFRNKKNVL